MERGGGSEKKDLFEYSNHARPSNQTCCLWVFSAFFLSSRPDYRPNLFSSFSLLSLFCFFVCVCEPNRRGHGTQTSANKLEVVVVVYEGQLVGNRSSGENPKAIKTRGNSFLSQVTSNFGCTVNNVAF